MAKSYWGNHKHNHSDWETLGSAGVYDKVNWIVYRRKGEGEWRDIKVSARGPAPDKANYWTAWNGTRLAGSLCLKQMAEHRSDLLEGLAAFMEKVTLSDIRGLTPPNLSPKHNERNATREPNDENLR